MRRLIRRLLLIPIARSVQLSAVLTILALALMVWSILQPTWIPVILAMSLGQALGTVAFALYGIAIWRDLRQARRARRDSKSELASKVDS